MSGLRGKREAKGLTGITVYHDDKKKKYEKVKRGIHDQAHGDKTGPKTQRVAIR